jgi:hypothetical protein
MIEKYTTIDTILAKLSRDTGRASINESDTIEWIGEALSFLSVYPSEEQAIAFLEVKNYEAPLPLNLQTILQVARNNHWSPQDNNNPCGCPQKVEEYLLDEDCEDCSIMVTDCGGSLLCEDSKIINKPYFDLQYGYSKWVTNPLYKQVFTPVRLANNSFFNTIVSKEKSLPYAEDNGIDEYTIVGTYEKILRFSFKEGQVVVPYTRTALDSDTGYPLVPDNISLITAVVYYVKWKMAEVLEYSGRAGATQLAEKSEQRWLKYVKQAKNSLSMPQGIDKYQNMLESSHQMIPNHKRYYNFFGNLGRPDSRKYADPDGRNNNIQYSYRGGNVINQGRHE